jgi:hypothetical protein
MRDKWLQIGIVYSLVSTSLGLIVIGALWVDWEVGKRFCAFLALQIPTCRGISAGTGFLLALASGLISFLKLRKL